MKKTNKNNSVIEERKKIVNEKPYIESIDENGTERWASYECKECGGTGVDKRWTKPYPCHRCIGTGRHKHKWKVLTKEYALEIEKSKPPKPTKPPTPTKPPKPLKGPMSAEEMRSKFLKENGFNSERTTFVLVEDVSGRENLFREKGGQKCACLGWHFSVKPENVKTVEILFRECLYVKRDGNYAWLSKGSVEYAIESKIVYKISNSEYVGIKEEEIELDVYFKKVVYLTGCYGLYMLYIFNDLYGNTIVWKTNKRMCSGFDMILIQKEVMYKIVGMVKDKLEYQGDKQTFITLWSIDENKGVSKIE